MLLAIALNIGCSGDSEDSKTPSCDQKCQDNTALRAIREMVKLIYNSTLQGAAVGAQDKTRDCPQGGSARVFGVATSNAFQGSNELDLTYEFQACSYLQRDEDAGENYYMTLSGTISEQGTLAIQPTASTSLTFQSASMAFGGTVYDPPIVYPEVTCELRLGQNGNRLSGIMCGRIAGLDL